MNLPTIHTHRCVSIIDLLSEALLTTEEGRSFYEALADAGQCSWGDNHATLIRAEFLIDFIGEHSQHMEIEQDKITNLIWLLRQADSENISIDLLS
jgi:hypothetical protein